MLNPLGLALSEKQIPQVVENLESGDEQKEALEYVVMRPRQVRYQAALRPDKNSFLDFKLLSVLSTLPRQPKWGQNSPNLRLSCRKSCGINSSPTPLPPPPLRLDRV
jgi:hypothetical protein